MKKLILAATLSLAAVGMAQAESPSYSYAEFNHFEGNGYSGNGIHGSAAISDNIFAFASYESAELDFFSIDVDGLSLGAGYNMDMSESTSWYIAAAFLRADVEDISDNGYGIETGIRSMVANSLEVGIAANYTDIFDDSDTTVDAYAQYFFSENWSVKVDVSSEDDYDYGIGVRFTF